jgi:hypothetical protein
VRDVLEGALDMVEHIVEDGVEIARRSRGAPPRPPAALDAVWGWQEIILNRRAACAKCAASLGVGKAAHRGLTDEPGPPAFLCGGCIRRLCEPACGDEHRHRADTGHAAEEFARRIVRDAQRFGERVAEHASGFARKLEREWHHGPGFDTKPIAADLQNMLREVRSLVGDVVDGVDQLIVRLFQDARGEARGEAADEPWTRVVTSREVTCAACGKTIGAGDECHLRRRPDVREFRCVACGPPAEQPAGA